MHLIRKKNIFKTNFSGLYGYCKPFNSFWLILIPGWLELRMRVIIKWYLDSNKGQYRSSFFIVVMDNLRPLIWFIYLLNCLWVIGENGKGQIWFKISNKPWHLTFSTGVMISNMVLIQFLLLDKEFIRSISSAAT